MAERPGHTRSSDAQNAVLKNKKFITVKEWSGHTEALPKSIS